MRHNDRTNERKRERGYERTGEEWRGGEWRGKERRGRKGENGRERWRTGQELKGQERNIILDERRN